MCKLMYAVPPLAAPSALLADDLGLRLLHKRGQWLCL